MPNIDYGDPRWRCVGSGFCCHKAPCWESTRVHQFTDVQLRELFGDESKKGCPSLREQEDGTFRCGLVAEATTARERARLINSLHIGAGCCASMNTTRHRILSVVRATSSQAPGPLSEGLAA